VYRGTEGGQVLLDDGTGADLDRITTAFVDVGKVETVLIDVSSAGPE
jgi:hypothetical protein